MKLRLFLFMWFTVNHIPVSLYVFHAAALNRPRTKEGAARDIPTDKVVVNHLRINSFFIKIQMNSNACPQIKSAILDRSMGQRIKSFNISNRPLLADQPELAD